MDRMNYKYNVPSCWTLASGHCTSSPSYAVFIKKGSGKLPLAMKTFIGGHSVEIDPSSGAVRVNGQSNSVTDAREYIHKVANVEVFKITKWGATYHIYSYLRVWVIFDGNFVNVTPAPSVKGQHCGLCGNYNRNRWDDMMGKDGNTIFENVDDFVKEYKWTC